MPRIVELEKQREELLAKKRVIEAEILDINLLITAEKFSPFTNGQDVMCEVSIGRSKKVTRCKLRFEPEQSFVRVKVYPYKKDGGLSNRGFLVFDKRELQEV